MNVAEELGLEDDDLDMSLLFLDFLDRYIDRLTPEEAAEVLGALEDGVSETGIKEMFLMNVEEMWRYRRG